MLDSAVMDLGRFYGTEGLSRGVPKACGRSGGGGSSGRPGRRGAGDQRSVDLHVAPVSAHRLRRRAGLRGVSGRPTYRNIPQMATASDTVDRDFTPWEPNRLQVTDIAEHPTREGKVYCAVVLDAFSRRVVGWSIDSRPTAALVTNALGMAIDNRQPTEGETVIHSDHRLNPANSPRGPSPAAPSTTESTPVAPGLTFGSPHRDSGSSKGRRKTCLNHAFTAIA